ncbi:MAG: tetratricopeptide repeat protein [Xanthobacteraceae bacterium]
MRLSVLMVGVAAFLMSAGSVSVSRARADDVETCNKGSGNAAIAACTRAIASHKLTGRRLAQVYVSRGEGYRQLNDYDHSLADLSQAIKSDPTYSGAWYSRGVTLYFMHDFEHAIEDYHEAIRLNPKDPSPFLNRCRAYVAMGDYDHAIADADHAFALGVSTFGERVAYDCRATAHYAKGDYNHAIADYTEVIRLDPKDANAYFARGRLYLYTSALSKALADFKQASELDPKSAYKALWLDIAERRNNIPSHLAQAAKQLDMTAWPAPVVRLFLGELRPAQALAAADDKDQKTKQGQVCEAIFYTGELALLQGARADAARVFRLAASECPHGFVEWGAANAELKALGAPQ